MGERYALLLAVEKYQDWHYGTVAFAQADAEAISEVLVHHGFAKANQVSLLNAEATKARIDSHLRRALDRLQEDDELYIYFVGHGFSDGARNFIACYDTVWADAVRTSLALQDIFGFVRTSKSHKIVMLLDTCHSGIEIGEEARGILAGMTEPEIARFFKDSEYYACFASCKADEQSYPSTALGHGIWTHHVVEALSGRATDAAESGTLVTSSSLQRYLSRAVPLTLRQTKVGLKTQTPVVFGNMTRDFLIADVDHLVRARRAAAQAPADLQLKRITFSADRSARVKSLSGFQKRYRIPEKADDYTNNWVVGLAKKEMAEALEEAHQLIKSNLGYRRKEMTSEVSDGIGTIVTPDFTFQISVNLDKEDPSEVIWKREIINLTNPEITRSPEFDAAFGDSFNRIEFEFSKALDLEELIDQLEASEELEVEYPHDCSSCKISSDEFEFTLIVTPSVFTLEFRERETPQKLIAGFFNAQKKLLAQPNVFGLLSFG